ncbi:MAG: uroporphyrinogen decarboxylase family protein [Planctomycetota bacterium]
MTPKERVSAALEGRPVDRFPTAVLYHHLFVEVCLPELTDRPPWWVYALPYLEPEEYLPLYRRIIERAPFDVLEPSPGGHSRSVRKWQEFVEKAGRPFRHDTHTDEWFPLDTPTKSGFAHDGSMNETQRLFTRRDIDEEIKIRRAGEISRDGQLDQLEAAVAEFGDDHFMLRVGPSGALGLSMAYFGTANTMAMLIEQPDLIDTMTAKSIEQAVETLRRIAAAGVDGVYCWESMGTGELISPAHYERFCLPYSQTLVEEAHRLGLKIILAFYGDVMDRLELIAATGADALQAECAMKGYTNDIHEIAEAIGDRITLFANIDPYWCLEKATDAELEAEVRRQVAAGRKARGFILSPASPITPGTPLARVQKFIELCHEIG